MRQNIVDPTENPAPCNDTLIFDAGKDKALNILDTAGKIHVKDCTTKDCGICKFLLSKVRFMM